MAFYIITHRKRYVLTFKVTKIQKMKPYLLDLGGNCYDRCGIECGTKRCKDSGHCRPNVDESSGNSCMSALFLKSKNCYATGSEQM